MNTQKIELVKEGNSNIFVFKKKETLKGPAARNSEPFYNPSMEQNRDL